MHNSHTEYRIPKFVCPRTFFTQKYFFTKKSFWKTLRTLALPATVLYGCTGQWDATTLRHVQCRLSLQSRVPEAMATNMAPTGAGPGFCGWGYSYVGMAMPLFHTAMSPWDVVSGAVMHSGSGTILLCFFLRDVAGSSPVDSVLPPQPIHSRPLKSFGRAQLCCGCCSEAANQVERSLPQAKMRGAKLSPSQEAELS